MISFISHVPSFASGHIAERMDLRYFLTGGMILSGLFTSLMGLAYFLEIHSFTYFIVIQVSYYFLLFKAMCTGHGCSTPIVIV